MQAAVINNSDGRSDWLAEEMQGKCSGRHYAPSTAIFTMVGLYQKLVFKNIFQYGYNIESL